MSTLPIGNRFFRTDFSENRAQVESGSGDRLREGDIVNK